MFRLARETTPMRAHRFFRSAAFFGAFLVALCGSTLASRADVVWTLTGTFEDGATVSGTFTWTVDNYLSSANGSLSLVTTPGYLSGASYALPGSFPNGGVPANTFDITNGYFQNLYVTFLNPLTTPSSVDPIVFGFECYAWSCPGPDTYPTAGGDTRYFVSGYASAAATPLPATWSMMLIGMAGLGFVGYRQNSKKNALLAAA
jgi:hypothetical protein